MNNNQNLVEVLDIIINNFENSIKLWSGFSDERAKALEDKLWLIKGLRTTFAR